MGYLATLFDVVTYNFNQLQKLPPHHPSPMKSIVLVKESIYLQGDYICWLVQPRHWFAIRDLLNVRVPEFVVILNFEIVSVSLKNSGLWLAIFVALLTLSTPRPPGENKPPLVLHQAASYFHHSSPLNIPLSWRSPVIPSLNSIPHSPLILIPALSPPPPNPHPIPLLCHPTQVLPLIIF